jgi:hypothetical protein
MSFKARTAGTQWRMGCLTNSDHKLLKICVSSQRLPDGTINQTTKAQVSGRASAPRALRLSAAEAIVRRGCRYIPLYI